MKIVINVPISKSLTWSLIGNKTHFRILQHLLFSFCVKDKDLANIY